MSVNHVMKAGEFLGLCNVKGYLYSMFQGYTTEGKQRFTIVAVKGGRLDTLITYTCPSLEE